MIQSKLKSLFSKFAGKHPVDIEFLEKDKTEAVVKISSSWGVSLDEAFLAELTKNPAIVEHKIHEINK